MCQGNMVGDQRFGFRVRVGVGLEGRGQWLQCHSPTNTSSIHTCEDSSTSGLLQQFQAAEVSTGGLRCDLSWCVRVIPSPPYQDCWVVRRE